MQWRSSATLLNFSFFFRLLEFHKYLGSIIFAFFVVIFWYLHQTDLPEHSRALKFTLSLLFNLSPSCQPQVWVPPWNAVPLLLIVKSVFGWNFPGWWHSRLSLQVKVCISSHQFSSLCLSWAKDIFIRQNNKRVKCIKIQPASCNL